MSFNESESYKPYRTKRKGFYQIDNEIVRIHGRNIGAYGIAVYNVLMCYAEDGEFVDSLTIDQIGQMIDCCKATVRKALDKLQDEGLILKEERLRGAVYDKNLTHRIQLLDVDKVLPARNGKGSASNEPGVVHDVNHGVVNQMNHAKAQGGARREPGVVHEMHPLKYQVKDLKNVDNRDRAGVTKKVNATLTPVSLPVGERTLDRFDRAYWLQSNAYRVIGEYFNDPSAAERILRAWYHEEERTDEWWVSQMEAWKAWVKSPEGSRTIKVNAVGFVYTKMIGGAKCPTTLAPASSPDAPMSEEEARAALEAKLIARMEYDARRAKQ